MKSQTFENMVKLHQDHFEQGGYILLEQSCEYYNNEEVIE